MPRQFIIVIPTCEKNKARLEAVQETWVKDLRENFKLLYVFARPDEKTELRGNYLYLDCPESYEEGPRKVIAIYNFLIKNFAFDYIYKCDDDTYVDLEKFVELNLEGKDYLGNFATDKKTAIDPTAHYGKCTNKLLEVPYRGKFIVPWARGGRGYILSRHATEELCRLTTNQDLEELFEDKMVGEVLSRAKNIKTLHFDKSQMPSLHPIQASEMYLIHSLHKTNRSLLKENPILKEKLLSLNASLEQQKEKDLRLKESNEALSIKNEILLKDASLFKTQKSEFAEKYEQLKSERNRIKEEFRELKAQKDLLRERNDILGKEKIDLRDRSQHLKEQKNLLLEKNKKLVDRIESLESELIQIKQSKLYRLEEFLKRNGIMWSRGGSNP